jgi:hypothetical protein
LSHWSRQLIGLGERKNEVQTGMPDMIGLCKWLEQTSIGTAVRDSLWLFPTIETLHLFGIVLLVGSTSALDLRLLGLSLRNQSVSTVAARLLPWAWVGFVVQIVTGILLFSSEATKCYVNLAFRLKMLMILLAGVNAMVFHWTAYRSVGKWDDAPSTPIGAKLAGSFSILLWFGIVAAGRWIAFI